MTQTSGNLAMDDMEAELDKVISEMSDSTKPPVVEQPKSYPFAAGHSTAEALRGAAAIAADERPAFRPRPLSALERKPIPPQHPVDRTVNEQRADHGLPPVQPVAVRHDAAIGSEVERFMASGERLLDVQRKKIQTLESEYEVDRVKLIDAYRVKMREMEHEAGDALRTFDLKYQADAADAKRILDALVAMRG